MSSCADLIGMPFELGADGSNGKIDCIHLCYLVLERVGIAPPPFKTSWYGANKHRVLRDLLNWGERIRAPQYDGDILLLPQQSWAFAVTWDNGILYINQQTQTVAWSLAHMFMTPHCFRTKSS
jgi:hypothetical protein